MSSCTGGSQIGNNLVPAVIRAYTSRVRSDTLG